MFARLTQDSPVAKTKYCLKHYLVMIDFPFLTCEIKLILALSTNQDTNLPWQWIFSLFDINVGLQVLSAYKQASAALKSTLAETGLSEDAVSSTMDDVEEVCKLSQVEVLNEMLLLRCWTRTTRSRT
jgi:hypothetical protein